MPTKLGIPFYMIGDGQKSAKMLKGYSAPAILYPYKDLGDLIRRECPRESTKVLRHKPDSKTKIRPEICRAVAQLAAPPSSMRKIWKDLQEFLE